MTRPYVVVKLCKKCFGSKWRLSSVGPIRFKRCNKCQGRGGRTIAREGAKP